LEISLGKTGAGKLELLSLTRFGILGISYIFGCRFNYFKK
jgi:hypothetical protein